MIFWPTIHVDNTNLTLKTWSSLVLKPITTSDVSSNSGTLLWTRTLYRTFRSPKSITGAWITKSRAQASLQKKPFYFNFFQPLNEVLFCVIWTERESGKKTQPICSHLDGESSVNKGFILWKITLFSCGTQRVIPSGQLAPISPSRVGNQSHHSRSQSSCQIIRSS